MTDGSVVSAASTEVCQLWVAPEEAFECCPALTETDTDRMVWAIQQASDILFRLSGARYPGLCTSTVRPCTSPTSCWVLPSPPLSPFVLPYGYPDSYAPDWGWGGWYASRDCSCVRLSKIRLAGYPVQSIEEVIIDGDTLDASEYRLDSNRVLVRLANAEGVPQQWPGCQNLSINDGPGTFFVTYTYGQNPPSSGIAACAQLACEIMKQCPDSDAEIGDCALPEGTVRVARQGITIDTQALGLWMIGQIRTGMPLVDAFISVWGSSRRRRVAFMSPEADPWPLRVG